jgi:hypothetical protein
MDGITITNKPLQKRAKQLLRRVKVQNHLWFRTSTALSRLSVNNLSIKYAKWGFGVLGILAEGGKTQGDLLREHFGVEE